MKNHISLSGLSFDSNLHKTINVIWKCENQESTENVKIENQPKNDQNMGTLKTNLRIH